MDLPVTLPSVSYTHLDVYKRQAKAEAEAAAAAEAAANEAPAEEAPAAEAAAE